MVLLILIIVILILLMARANLLSVKAQLVMMMMMMMMMMMNCFDRQKAVSRISSRDECQRFSPSQISDMLQAEFELVQNVLLSEVV